MTTDNEDAQTEEPLPAILGPKATTQAPVSVAKSTTCIQQ